MLGFIIGTVCLIGLLRTIRRSGFHYGRFGDGAYGCGHGRLQGFGPRGFGRSHWLLRSVLERLDTTPGQEKVIVSALEELRENRAACRDEIQRTRGELARVVASGFVDDSVLDETFASHDRLLARLRVSLVEAIKKITEALDERQRKELARMLEGGGWFGGGRGWGGAHRGVWA